MQEQTPTKVGAPCEDSTTEVTCPNCGGTDTVLVWENKQNWQSGGEPDFIGCEDCHIMER